MWLFDLLRLRIIWKGIEGGWKGLKQLEFQLPSSKLEQFLEFSIYGMVVVFIM